MNWVLFIVLGLYNVKIESNPSAVCISYRNVSVQTKEVALDQGNFIRLSINGEAGVSNEIGKPDLPVIRKLIEIPYNGEAEVSVKVKKFYISKITAPVYPVQPPRPKIKDAQIEFAWDKRAYKANAFVPDYVVRIADEVKWRGHHLVQVEIYPVAYNPVTQELKVYKDFDVIIKFKGGSWNESTKRRLKYGSRPFETEIKEIVINYAAAKEPPLDVPIGYLIIVPDEYYDSVLTLANWYRKKGYHVSIAKTSQTGTSRTAIKNYIQNAYDNWNIPPTFVLLVGDVDKIPYWTGQGEGRPHTDLNYSLLEGNDYFPDVYLSRLSVSNLTELVRVINKILWYEKTDWSTYDWAKKAFFIASADPSFHQIAEGTHNYCINLVRSHGMEADSFYAYYQSGAPTAITNALNTGRSWCVYSGHGSTTGWSDYGDLAYNISDVYNLSNSEKLPLILSFACLTGSYASYNECFMEAWIRAPGGAISAMGSSVGSYWYEDDIFQRRIFDEMFDSNFVWIMGGINNGKIELYNYYGNTPRIRRYFEMYNLMGNGAIDVFTDEPHVITVDHPSFIPIGEYDLTVTVTHLENGVENAFVCAMTSDSIFEGYTNSDGIVTLHLFVSKPETVYVTVTGHNLKTYEGLIQAYRPGEVTIEPDTIPVAETTEVTVTVTDTAGAPLQDVWVRINGWGVSVEGYTDSDGQVMLS
ncbi:MAG: hypothetical protein DRJ45_07290, partial [Thermoprotei archaeon]